MRKKLIIILIILVLFFLALGYFFYNKKNDITLDEEIVFVDKKEEKNEKIIETKYIYVDIKGQVKNPGVYSLIEGTNINDLIILAGGLKSNGTTENINLAKKLEDEMIIIIKSKTALSNYLKSNDKVESICSTNSYDCSECLKNNSNSIIVNEQAIIDIDNKTSNKVSLNKASKEELMGLSGIGESKANAIIEYRNINGEFKNIEDLLNVSGIGESIFEKIKDNITI